MPSKCWCNFCNNGMLRMYVRESKWAYRSHPRRKFVAVGWYCIGCRVFQLDQNDIIENVLRRSDYRYNQHRIYIRSTDKHRAFVAIAYYYVQDQLFELDKPEWEDFKRSMKVQYNTKTYEEACEKMRQQMSPEYRKVLDEIKEVIPKKE